mmetsp:Transcript_17885/g.42993  ORF Transcript_17885/g.42993 Transcript_17885/m.42993 type:complete len:281 (-) Transcript_17885:1323-2165(-)
MKTTLLAIIGVAIQLNHRVQRHRHIQRFATVQSLPVRDQHAQDCLVADDQQGFPHTLHLQHNGVQPVDHIQVGFTSGVAIRQLVASPAGKLVRMLSLDLLIRHAVTLPSVDLVEILPLSGSHLDPLQLLAVVASCGHGCARYVPGSLLRPPQRTCPQPRWNRPARLIPADLTGGEVLEFHGVGFAGLRESRIPANLAESVVLRLPVPREVEHVPAGVRVQHVGHHVAQQVSVDVGQGELVEIVDLHPRGPIVEGVVHVERLVGVADHALDAPEVVNNSVV